MSMDTFSRPCRPTTRIAGDDKTCGGDLECLGPWQRPPRSQDIALSGCLRVSGEEALRGRVVGVRHVRLWWPWRTAFAVWNHAGVEAEVSEASRKGQCHGERSVTLSVCCVGVQLCSPFPAACLETEGPGTNFSQAWMDGLGSRWG